jgi:hypothetical protein
VADTVVGSEVVVSEIFVRTGGYVGSVADTVVGSEIFVRTGGYVGSVADTVVGHYGAIF